jgi:hypothetical protein
MRYLFKIASFSFLIFAACSTRSNRVKNKKIIRVVELADDALIRFWKDFSIKFNSLDTAAIKQIILDSVWLWGDNISSQNFIKRYASGYSISEFRGILDLNNTSYGSIGCYPSPPVAEAIKQEYSDAFSCKQVTIINDTVGSTVNAIKFSFLETTRGYRLSGINNYPYPVGYYNSSPVDTTVIQK